MKSVARNTEKGQVLPLMAMLLVCILGIIGLAVDLGRVYVTKAQLSRSLDAAALAGVVDLPLGASQATTKAVTYMNLNMPQASNVSAVPDAPNQRVTISATAHVSTIFLRVLGITSVDVHADAQAGASSLDNSNLPLDALILLDDTGTMRSNCTVPQVTTPTANQDTGGHTKQLFVFWVTTRTL